VLALGLVFANYNYWLALFAALTIAALAVIPFAAPRFFSWVGVRVSEPEIKFVLLVLFGLGGLANLAQSEAVLPAYVVGMALAPLFLANRELQSRIRVMAFAFLPRSTSSRPGR
jgi:Kef-type K+ transport system membrane component KefB